MSVTKKATGVSATTMLTAALCLTAASPVAADANLYIGEIAPMGLYNFCPTGSMSAEGQLLSIAQYTALYSLLGTMYGGNGQTTFALPDLRGRIPIGVGSGPGLTTFVNGMMAGQETVTLSISNLAAHSHLVNATNLDGDSPGPRGKILAAAPVGGTGAETIYSDQAANVQMSSEMISPTGGGQPLNTQDPTQAIRYCIAYNGIFPPRP